MIEVKDLRKSYKTGDFVQRALDGVSLAFRDSEFVAVLGTSGSGKTTLLNVIGGLDHADSGEIVINGTSTEKYKSSDWDTYRNHEVGFIFQSYNLIPHQTVLSNVELALTISGVSSQERKVRAEKALSETNRPLRLIAQESGYKNVKTFEAAFRKRHGTSPGLFRKNN